MSPCFGILFTFPVSRYILFCVTLQLLWLKRSVSFVCSCQIWIQFIQYAFVSDVKRFSLQFGIFSCWYYALLINNVQIITFSRADPGFSVGGGANRPGEGGAPTYEIAKFSEKLHEIEKISGRRVGARAPCTP